MKNTGFIQPSTNGDNKKQRSRSSERLASVASAHQDTGMPNCRKESLMTPNIAINTLFMDEHVFPSVEEDRAAPITTKMASSSTVRLTDVATLIQTLQELKSFQFNGQSYEIDVDNQELQNLLNVNTIVQASQSQRDPTISDITMPQNNTTMAHAPDPMFSPTDSLARLFNDSQSMPQVSQQQHCPHCNNGGGMINNSLSRHGSTNEELKEILQEVEEEVKQRVPVPSVTPTAFVTESIMEKPVEKRRKDFKSKMSIEVGFEYDFSKYTDMKRIPAKNSVTMQKAGSVFGEWMGHKNDLEACLAEMEEEEEQKSIQTKKPVEAVVEDLEEREEKPKSDGSFNWADLESEDFDVNSYVSGVKPPKLAAVQTTMAVPVKKKNIPRKTTVQTVQSSLDIDFDDDLTGGLSAPTKFGRQTTMMDKKALIKREKEKKRKTELLIIRQEPQKVKNKSNTDVLFLHASPNILTYDITVGDNVDKKQMTKPAVLDFVKESKTIKQALDDSGRKVSFQSKVATKSNFEQTMCKKPQILHISCHGVRGQVKQSMSAVNADPDAGHYLLFENEQGDGQLVSASTISEFLKKENIKLNVVFVAACDSEVIGSIFQRNGAKHVICVKTDRFVLDEAAITFTKTFYRTLFQVDDEGRFNVCTAFSRARQATGFQIKSTEANLFIMLKQEDRKNALTGEKLFKTQHKCETLPYFPEGEHQCISDHNMFKDIPTKLPGFKFREKEMSKLLESLIEKKQRIIPILGLRGIGKSSLARNTMHYVSDRKIFTGAILFIKLKDVRSTISMLKIIVRNLMKILTLSNADKKSLQESLTTHEDMVQYLIEFFTNKKKEKSQKEEQKGANKSKNQLYLISLDNAETLVEHDREEFVDFLKEMFDACPALHIIVTSNRQVGANEVIESANPQLLQQLKHIDAVQLFRDNCGEIDENEIYDLIIKDSSYPYTKFGLVEDEDIYELELTESIRKNLRSKLRDPDSWNAMLAYHDMFNHLLGNPTSIKQMALIHQSKANYSEKLTLSDLYGRIQSEKSSFINELGENGELIPRQIQNSMSLNVAAEMTIKMIQETEHKKDINLIYFLGCIPGGLTRDQLQEIWDVDINPILVRLEEMNFIDDLQCGDTASGNKVILNSNMINYIQSNLDFSTKQDIMHQICFFYETTLTEFYEKIGRRDDYSTMLSLPSEGLDRRASFKQQVSQHKNSEMIFEKMANELRNIECCINFLLEFSQNFEEVQTQEIEINDVDSEASVEETKSEVQQEEDTLVDRSVFKRHGYVKQQTRIFHTQPKIKNKKPQRNSDSKIGDIKKVLIPEELDDIKEEDDDSFGTDESWHSGLENSQRDSQAPAPSKKIDSNFVGQGTKETEKKAIKDDATPEKQKSGLAAVLSNLLKQKVKDEQERISGLEIVGGAMEIMESEELSDSDESYEEEQAARSRAFSHLSDNDEQNIDSSRMSMSPSKKKKLLGTCGGLKDLVDSGILKKQIQAMTDKATGKRRISVTGMFKRTSVTETPEKAKDNISIKTSQSQLLDKRKSITMQKNELDCTIWVPMSTEGVFILMMSADTFLTHDYEYSLQISSGDFRKVTNTPLFEGNIMRFRALANYGLFKGSSQKWQEVYGKLVGQTSKNSKGIIIMMLQQKRAERMQEIFLYLTNAIASLENAHSIYEAKDEMKENEKNHYGMALCSYTLGHLYREFQNELCEDNKHYEGLCEEEYKQYLTKTVEEARARASYQYKKAYGQFKQRDHLIGMKMCMQHLVQLLPEDSTAEERKSLESTAATAKKNFDLYCINPGIKNSCHIPREHGEDMSIMTEIVYAQTNESLFPGHTHYASDYENSQSSRGSLSQSSEHFSSEDENEFHLQQKQDRRMSQMPSKKKSVDSQSRRASFGLEKTKSVVLKTKMTNLLDTRYQGK